MTLSLLSEFNLQKEQIDQVELFKQNVPELQNLFNEFTQRSENHLKNYKQKLIDNNMYIDSSFLFEEKMVQKLCYLIYALHVSLYINKHGLKNVKNLIKQRDEQIALRNKMEQNILDKEKEYEKIIKEKNENKITKVEYDEKIKEFKKEYDNKATTLNENLLKKYNKVLMTPVNVKDQKSQSIYNFITADDMLLLCGIEKNNNGLTKINGKQINDMKASVGKNKRDKPKVKDNEEYLFK